MRDLQRFESDGYFWLSYIREYDYDVGIGRGGETTTSRFPSPEARECFIRTAEADERARTAQRWLDSFKRSLLECVTPSGRIRRKRLIALVERAKP